MATWNSKYAIWRDLSLVQGAVPAEIDYTVAHDERPPRVPIEEETEEHFYSSYCSGDGASVVSAPDIDFISKMLAEAHQVDSEDEPPTVHDQAVPSTRSFTANMFARKKTKTSSESSSASSPTQESTDTTARSKPAYQPQSFVPSARAASYYVKFYERSKLGRSNDDQSKPLHKKKETIWDRIERQMNEIDATRKLKAEKGGAKTEAKGSQSAKREAEGVHSAKTEAEEITSTKTEAERTHSKSKRPGPQGIDRVRLPDHLHNMLTNTGDCIVCAAVYKAYPALVCGHNSTPLESTARDSTPLESIQSDMTPLESVPNDSTPLEPVPNYSTPLEPVSSDSTPLETTPFEPETLGSPDTQSNAPRSVSRFDAI